MKSVQSYLLHRLFQMLQQATIFTIQNAECRGTVMILHDADVIVAACQFRSGRNMKAIGMAWFTLKCGQWFASRTAHLSHYQHLCGMSI